MGLGRPQAKIGQCCAYREGGRAELVWRSGQGNDGPEPC